MISRINKSGKRKEQQRLTLEAVRKYQGLTSKELSVASGLPRDMLARRLGETDGITRGEQRTCDIADTKAVVWRAE